MSDDFNREIPDALPDDFEVPGQTPIRIGLNPDAGLVILQVGDAKMVGLPVAEALQVGHNIMTKALHMLFNPPAPPEDRGPGLVLP